LGLVRGKGRELVGKRPLECGTSFGALQIIAKVGRLPDQIGVPKEAQGGGVVPMINWRSADRRSALESFSQSSRSEEHGAVRFLFWWLFLHRRSSGVCMILSS
jgi:hypothetical protein